MINVTHLYCTIYGVFILNILEVSAARAAAAVVLDVAASSAAASSVGCCCWCW